MIKKIIYFIENVNERVEIAKRGHMKFKKTYEGINIIQCIKKDRPITTRIKDTLS